MKRLQKYIGRKIIMEPVRDEQWLESAGVSSRYVPEELEEFDEMEFGLGQWGDKPVTFTLVLENGTLQRVSLGWISDEAEDDMHAFSQPDLAEVLNNKGSALVDFFERVTEP